MSKTLDPDSTAPSALASYSLLRESCGILAIEHDSIFEFRGEDRKAWLQGQATNDVRQLHLGGSLAFCLCSPTGQLLADCTVWSLPDRYLVVTSKKSACELAKRAAQMIIMEDVQVTEVTDRYDWLSVQGPSATRELAQLIELPALDGGTATARKEEAVLLRCNRTGFGGWDVLVPRKSGFSRKLHESFESVAPEAVEVARLEFGLPRLGTDADERTLPAELGPNFESRHVSYSKGCYTGQEVLMRIHSRGHTNKCWVGLSLDAPVAPGMPVKRGDKEVGIVTSFADSPRFGYIAAAMLRNEAAAEGEEISVAGVGGEVVMLPFLRTV